MKSEKTTGEEELEACKGDGSMTTIGGGSSTALVASRSMPLLIHKQKIISKKNRFPGLKSSINTTIYQFYSCFLEVSHHPNRNLFSNPLKHFG